MFNHLGVTGLKVLMERESANPEFGFMFNLQSPEHMYFRWRLYSLAQGMHTVRRPEPLQCLLTSSSWEVHCFSEVSREGQESCQGSVQIQHCHGQRQMQVTRSGRGASSPSCCSRAGSGGCRPR